MQGQESQSDDVYFCLFQRWKVQEHRKFLLRNLLGHQLLHLWIKIRIIPLAPLSKGGLGGF